MSWAPATESPTPWASPTVDESPSDEPAPDEGLDSLGQDIGLGFPVCNVSSIEADFADLGARGIAYVATRIGDVGGCSAPEDAFNVVALDADGDGRVDATVGPIECTLECRAFSAPDLDGDSTADLLVVQDGGAVVGLGLYDVVVRDGTPTILPVDVAAPGDPDAGLRPERPAELWLGGDEFELYTLRCADYPDSDGPVLLVTLAESLPHDSPDATWHAHEITFALRDGVLQVVDLRDFTEPVDDTPSFASEETLCGSNLGL
jgi:hypothetical protein